MVVFIMGKLENEICQSCGMPMKRNEDFGTNGDGSKNKEYCQFCFKEGKFTDEAITMEQKISKDELKDLLMGVLDPENHLVPRISEIMEASPFDVMFISGVGEVFPYIRSHNVLNNLQSTAKEQPTVMFFPGLYTHSMESGASLNLFGKCPSDKYYRAFNIYHCEI